VALLGNAAMLLWYDIVPEAIEAHDRWHTQEHFPERVAIPGFIRAQRWVAESGSPRYFVVYEVADIGVLSGAPYLERLNDPTPWTSRMMPSFRGMTRGFCNIEHRHGTVLGSFALTVRFSSASKDERELAGWMDETLSALVERDGLTSAFLLASGTAPAMTKEQSIRGPDAGVDQVLLVTGYSQGAIDDLATTHLSATSLARHGAASNANINSYRFACSAISAGVSWTGPD
jgi:hypothetical protein